jgi:uncharacterized membrane protein YphA (DoxX/SURF4 family)
MTYSGVGGLYIAPKIRVSKLQRFFFAFPGGLPGLALLLLRTALGLAVLVQGGFYFRTTDTTPAQWTAGLAGLTLILGGVLLLIGFLTPVAGGIVGLGAVGIWLSLLPLSATTLFDSSVAVVFGATILLAVVILGPGAFSVDARVFGRREIIIPPPIKRTFNEHSPTDG